MKRLEISIKFSQILTLFLLIFVVSFLHSVLFVLTFLYLYVCPPFLFISQTILQQMFPLFRSCSIGTNCIGLVELVVFITCCIGNHPFRSCSIGTNWVGLVDLVGFFMCSTGNQPFLVGLVDQLFQPTRNPVELVENDGYQPLSQSWALMWCVVSTNTILFNTVGVWCPLSPGIRQCFQLSTENG